MQYYIYKNDQQLGPFEESEIRKNLQSGLIQPTDFAFCEGMTKWTPIQQILQLMIPSTSPPPIPKMNLQTQPTINPKKKVGIGTLLIVTFGAIIFSSIVGLNSKSPDINTTTGTALSQEASSVMRKCGWCGKDFKSGTGYNTMARLINSPDTQFSHYCSMSCAESFLRSTR